MLSTKVKQEVSMKVQAILQEIVDGELPLVGEISFILHVDGAESWSWANIRNFSERYGNNILDA